MLAEAEQWQLLPYRKESLGLHLARKLLTFCALTALTVSSPRTLEQGVWVTWEPQGDGHTRLHSPVYGRLSLHGKPASSRVVVVFSHELGPPFTLSRCLERDDFRIAKRTSAVTTRGSASYPRFLCHCGRYTLHEGVCEASCRVLMLTTTREGSGWCEEAEGRAGRTWSPLGA